MTTWWYNSLTVYWKAPNPADYKQTHGGIASTGVFMFPNEWASEIVVKTVRNYLDETGSDIKAVFNVFKDIDYLFYKNLLE